MEEKIQRKEFGGRGLVDRLTPIIKAQLVKLVIVKLVIVKLVNINELESMFGSVRYMLDRAREQL
jgi:hypothetical protein